MKDSEIIRISNKYNIKYEFDDKLVENIISLKLEIESESDPKRKELLIKKFNKLKKKFISNFQDKNKDTINIIRDLNRLN